MAAKFWTGVDLCEQQLSRARLENLSAAPTTAGAGKMYYDNGSDNNTYGRAILRSASAWKALAFTSDLDAYALKSSLGDYALKSTVDTLSGDVATIKENYVTKATYNNLNSTVNDINSRLGDIEAFFDGVDDQDNLINKWHEIVDFLNATDSDSLSGILATYAKASELTDAVNRIASLEGNFTDGKANNADKLDGKDSSYFATAQSVTTLSTTVENYGSRIDTLQGYFTNGAANKAVADGNGANIAATYATKSSYSTLQQTVISLGQDVASMRLTVNTLNTWYESVGKNFKYDSAKNAWYLDGNFYTTGENSAGGMGEDIGSVGGGSDVVFKPTLTSGTKIGEIEIDGTTTTIYAPASLKNPHALTFGGKTYDGSAEKTITASDLGAITDAEGITNKLGYTPTRKYTGTITANGSTSQSFTHNFNTRDVVVQLFEPSSPYEQVYADVRVSSVNQVTIAFAEAPTKAYKVVIIG